MTWTHAITHYAEKRSFLRFFSLKHMIFDLFNKAASYDEQMSISLPQCEACKCEPKAVDFSEEVDFPERRATFVAHKEFAERTKSLRPEQS